MPATSLQPSLLGLAVLRDLWLAAYFDVPVLVVGTGGHLVAREIHRASARRGGPYVTVDASQPHADLEGAYRHAEQGTLCIEHVERLEGRAQLRLFALTGEHLSGASTCPGARLVAIAGPGLARAVATARFSARLFYRLNSVRIELTSGDRLGTELQGAWIAGVGDQAGRRAPRHPVRGAERRRAGGVERLGA